MTCRLQRRDHNGSLEGPRVLTSMCCLLEKDTLSLLIVPVQPRKKRPDMTEKLLTGSYRIKSNKHRLQSTMNLDHRSRSNSFTLVLYNSS